MSVEDYLASKYQGDRLTQKRTGYSKEGLAEQGRVVRWDIVLIGLPNTDYPLFFSMFDAETNARVRTRSDEDGSVVTLYSEATEDHFSSFWWFQIPNPTRKHYVRLEVRNSGNQPMGDCKTPEF